MILHREDFGTAGTLPLVLVHGLMGQGRNLAGVARSMAGTRHVITVDLRNHGASPWDDSQTYPEMAADIVETLDEFDRFDIMGHSMGGKVAMTLALAMPECINKLMVVDIASIAYDHSHQQEIAALQALDLSAYNRRSDFDAALAPAIANPGMRAFFLHGLQMTPEKRWVNNLDALQNNMHHITGWHAPSGAFNGEALFVRGEKSDYVTDDGVARINAQFPNAEHRTVLGAGHWLHVEKPSEFQSIMREYFH